MMTAVLNIASMRRHGKVQTWSVLLGGTLVVLATGPGCTRDETPDVPDDPDVVASYQGGVVRRADFDAFRYSDVEEDPQVAEIAETDWREVSIERIVVRNVLVGEVAADPTPAVQRAITLSHAEILQAAMTEELGWNALSVSLEEVRHQYDTHPEQYKDPAKLRAQSVYLRAEVGVMPEAQRDSVRRELEVIRQEILNGADFGEMARQHSHSTSANSGGWLELDAGEDVFPEYAEVVWNLEDGEVSEIIETPTGFHVTKAITHVPPLDRKFEDVIEFARRRAVKDRLDAAKEAFVQEVGPRYGLERRYERLSDPFLSPDEGLVILDGSKYTFTELTEALPEHFLGQLYNAHLDAVIDFLDEVVVVRLLVLEARRLGLSERPQTAAALERASEEVLFQHARALRMEEKAAMVSDADLEEYFVQNEARYQTLRTRDVDVIFLPTTPDEPLWQTLKRGEALVGRIRAGEDFAELARAHSAHYSVANGGRVEFLTDYGVARRLQSKPRFHGILNNLEEGEVADATIAEAYDPEWLRYFQTGVIIVRLVKVHPPKQWTFEMAKDKVRVNYLRRNHQRLVDEVNQDVLDEANIQVYFDRLPSI